MSPLASKERQAPFVLPVYPGWSNSTLQEGRSAFQVQFVPSGLLPSRIVVPVGSSLEQQDVAIWSAVCWNVSIFPHRIAGSKVHRPLGQREPSRHKGRSHLPATCFGQPRQPGREDRGDDRAEEARPADGCHLAGWAEGGLVDEVHVGLSSGGFQARLIQLRTTKPGQALAAWSL